MRLRTICALFLALALSAITLAVPASSSAEERKKPLTIEGKSYLPLRVLSRAFSKIYQQPDVNSPTVEENVPAFQSFFVYEKKGGGGDLDGTVWYQVGNDNRGSVVGWMNSDDVFEWKQTMCLSYTHPEGRHPVLMFEKKGALEKYVSMPPEERKQKVSQLYEKIDQGQITPDFPVVTVEPKMAVDITKEFYLLPILDFSQIDLDDREARILRLAAVTKAGAGARESSDIRKNEQYRQGAVRSTEGKDVVKNLKIDVVWVMDTTNSMQPYIDQTLKVIQDASRRIAQDTKLDQALRFGIWAYRDSTEIPGIEYDVKNYTPQLEDVDSFVDSLAQVKACTVGSQGYDEDVFSGVNAALSETQWTPDAIRIVILVGDAPAHEPGHKWNLSKMNAQTLRALADEKNITLLALHIKNPEAESFHEQTEEQFMTLSTNPGVETPGYFTVDSRDLQGFETVVASMTEPIVDILSKAKAAGSSGAATASGSTGDGSTPAVPNAPGQAGGDLDLFAGPAPAGQEPAAGVAENVQQQTKENLKAAFVKWLGSQAGVEAPRDVVAWVTDKDLIDTDIQALEVRLLINKRQLDSLRETLQAILTAGRTGQISGDDFFSSLQAAAASTARDPEMIKRAKSLAQTGLIPEFLQGLPYTSRIMDMTNELWDSWSVDDQDMFLADLEARIMAYETIHDSPEGWVQLNKNDDPGDYVYPITLDLLP